MLSGASSSDLYRAFAGNDSLGWQGFWSGLPQEEVEGNSGADIQKAVDRLKDGGRIMLKGRRYVFEHTVRLISKIWIQGAGIRKTTLWLADDSGCHMFMNADQENGNSYMAISDLELDGNGEKQSKLSSVTALLFCNGLYAKRSDHIFVHNLEANHMHQTGLHFTRSAHVEISQYRARHLGWSGVSTSGTNDITIRSTRIVDAGKDLMHSGIHLDGGEGALVEAEICDVTGNGVMLDSKFAPLRRVVVKSKCYRCKHGTALSGLHEYPLENVYITGEYYSNREVGVMIWNSSNVVVDAALIVKNVGDGIRLQGRKGSRHCIISNNVLIENGRAIAELHESRDNYFVNNTEQGNKTPNEIISGPDHIYSGTCSVCGTYAQFEKKGRSVRETYRCPKCRASLRHRGQAEAIVKFFGGPKTKSLAHLAREPRFKKAFILEPALVGPFQKYLKGLKNYKNSYYWEDIQRGEKRNGVECQDLMAMTFRDNTFDLIITSDVFEHIRKPYIAFKEVYRVLKPGGVHIFSIPVQHPMPRETKYRVDTSTDKDVYLDPPYYHIAGDGGKSLVYTEFGADMLEQLDKIGLRTKALQVDKTDPNLSKLLTFVSRKV